MKKIKHKVTWTRQEEFYKNAPVLNAAEHLEEKFGETVLRARDEIQSQSDKGKLIGYLVTRTWYHGTFDPNLYPAKPSSAKK
jgi:hypothetical protein